MSFNSILINIAVSMGTLMLTVAIVKILWRAFVAEAGLSWASATIMCVCIVSAAIMSAAIIIGSKK